MKIYSGGGGLVSTTADYLQILSSLLNGGVGASGRQILKESTVNMMFENSLGPQAKAELENPVVSPYPEVINRIENMQPGYVFVSWLRMR